ncbi:BMP family ABC transporter substrate-binding protein [Desulforhopalus sp. IMCC35007]|uniref:BMP family ABC transporter substrate-binding protein n=1 Tax=Desulforhopalus sp. IMCC35007 TaxID=2569543 RepID=UPI00145DDE49|nr:BMP family ABC transporter substrate-binding protein [Desulforhopalus sp. IMCC35007]
MIKFLVRKYGFLALIFLLFLPVASLAQLTVGFLVPVSGLGDQSFNDITYAGLVKARNDFGFTLIVRQCQTGPLSHAIEMENLLDSGADIVVANGWEFADVVKESALENPTRLFILNDWPLTGFDNVISTVFSQHEGGFLAGALAALVTKSGKLGFVGGRDIEVIRAFQLGFTEGAEYISKDVRVVTTYLEGGGNIGIGFDDPSLGYSVALGLYDEDVDVIFSVAGLSGNGVIRAAAERKRYVIGVDADQDYMAKGYVLTSVMKRLDIAVYNVLHEISLGQAVRGLRSFDLDNGGVNLTQMLLSRETVTDEIRRTLDEIKGKIITKKIVVSNYLKRTHESR